MNFIFDIDGTLGTVIEENFGEPLSKIEEDYGFDFVNEHKIEAYNFPYFIYPGTYAILQWLEEKGNLFVFSSGIKARNEEFVSRLIQKSFPQRYEEVFAKIKIFSREDCINTEDFLDGDKYQGFFSGHYKKALTNIIVPEEEISQTILIDDDESYAVKGEEENILKVCFSYSLCKKNEKFLEGTFYSVHKMFFMAGILSKAFDLVAEKKISLREAVFYLQTEGIGRNFYQEKRRQLKAWDYREYYDLGLEVLKKYDSTLKYCFDFSSEMSTVR